ncbi:class I tRNA ligase family protein, partial [bacterium]|nr:class I tRNA ligase family protein [bacterium]
KKLRQDEDVLDTWFSSWLWPFSTLGWPNETADLKKFFPTDTLATGPDIIFFWVARMLMASLEFMDEIPFTDVYFNGMIRDLTGRKMSKSLGNSPDPLWLINGAEGKEMGDFAKENVSYQKGIPAYGADAVRMTMVYSTPLGGDVRFDHTLAELGQKFSNKLWNASRFVMMNLDDAQELLPLAAIKNNEFELADKWILSRLNRTIGDVDKAMTEFRMNDATHDMYSFIWTEFCDWYVELVKPRLYDDENPRRQQVARSIAFYLLDTIVRLLHPVMPFITEEIWQTFPGNENAMSEKQTIMEQQYPEMDAAKLDGNVEAEMQLLQQIIGAVRNIRGEMNVPPAKEAALIINSTDLAKVEAILNNENAIMKLARISSIEYNGKRPALTASPVVKGMDVFVPLADLIDVDLEKARLEKEMNRIEKQLIGLAKKLTNQNFLARAPEDVVAKEKQKQQDWQVNLEKLKQSRQNLQG